MRIHRQSDSLRAALKAAPSAERRTALVPTMGNLHAGHLSLVHKARQQAATVVASIFVNPMQFGPEEDYAKYPRTPEEDCKQLEAAGVEHLFLPDISDIYPDGMEAHTQVIVPGLSDILCGASRPGHFTGVATVVLKLLNLVRPDVAVFGEKDFQQLVLLRRLAADLALAVDIIAAPTVREPDGLAMSSRNRYLDEMQCQAASALYRTLLATRKQLQAGKQDFRALETAGEKALEAAGLTLDYYALRRQTDLGEARFGCKDVVVLAAASAGNTRLIDSVTIRLD